MDDIKLFTKNEKELETLIQAVRIYSEHIEMEFGKRKMSQAHNMKRKMTNDAENKTTKSRKIPRRKGNLQVLGNIGSEHHQTCKDERKKKKRIYQENEITT